MAANVKSYKWALSRRPEGAEPAGETTAAFTVSKLEVVREPNQYRQPYGGFTVTVEVELTEPKFGCKFMTGAKQFVIVDRQVPPRILPGHVTAGGDPVQDAIPGYVRFERSFRMTDTGPNSYEAERLADVAFWRSMGYSVDANGNEQPIEVSKLDFVVLPAGGYDWSELSSNFTHYLPYGDRDVKLIMRYWTSDYAGNGSEPYVLEHVIQ